MNGGGAASTSMTKKVSSAAMYCAVVAWIVLVELVASATAQTCNCSQRVGECSAKMNLTGQTLSFTATTQQCARITYSINGDPGVITIRGGDGRTDYLVTNRERRPTLSVDSCEICATTARSSAPTRPSVDEGCNATCVAGHKSQFNSCMIGLKPPADKQRIIDCGTNYLIGARQCPERCSR